jgi:hypothetical protein
MGSSSTEGKRTVMTLNRRVPAATVTTAILLALSATGAFAYDLQTHARMMSEAVNAANSLKDLESNLRLQPGQTFAPKSVDTSQYSQAHINHGTIEGWLREGVVLEDQNTGPVGASEAYRSVNHFYNPLPGALYGGGLSRFHAGVGWPSLDWGLTHAENSFSWGHARAHLLQALTAPNPASRDLEFGRSLRSLGGVVHLVNDLAQPQHTRNDAHLGVGPESFAGLASAYEKWAEDHFRTLPYGNYPAVYGSSDRQTFADARRFWTHGAMGLADFSNANFVSVGTNFHRGTNIEGPLQLFTHPDFASPVPGDVGGLVEIASFAQYVGRNHAGALRFVSTAVADEYQGVTYQNPYASTYSLWDEDLKAAGHDMKFTLNAINYAKAADYLIPRAVGYSAGVINYFFRGQIDLVADPATADSYLLRNLGPEPLAGTFALYYDDQDDTRHLAEGASWFLSLAPGQDAPVNVTLPPDAYERRGDALTLVFNGQMGSENAAGGFPGAVSGRAVGSPFLLIEQEGCGGAPEGQSWYAGNIYLSRFHDRGWQRVGDGPVWTVGRGFVLQGTYISEDLLFLNGDVQSTDGARSFTYLVGSDSFGSDSFVSIAYLGGAELMALMGDGRTKFSSNLGKSWEERALLTGEPSQIAHVGEGVVIAVLFGGGMLRSSDRGYSWQPTTPIIDGEPVDGWQNYVSWNQVVGEGSVLLAGGAVVWQEQGLLVRALYGGVFRSVDSGVTWSFIGLPVPPMYNPVIVMSVAISPSGEALAVADAAREEDGPEMYRSFLYASSDAGMTWVLREPESHAIAAGVVYLGNEFPPAKGIEGGISGGVLCPYESLGLCDSPPQNYPDGCPPLPPDPGGGGPEE